jgi:hypothetical protein
MSMAYHPQTDGQIKGGQQVPRNLFVMFCIRSTTPMGSMATLAKWWYNTTYHGATKMSPYEVVYGQKPPLVASYLLGTSKVQEVDHTYLTPEWPFSVHLRTISFGSK